MSNQSSSLVPASEEASAPSPSLALPAAGASSPAPEPVAGDGVRGLLAPACRLLALLTALTGVLYPLCITAIAQGAFPQQANGSLIERDGKVVGSALIGQPFRSAGYFWSRPSATNPPYDGAASTGSNAGPTNPALLAAVRELRAALEAGGGAGAPPPDLVTSSASGLDPHLSPAAALWQVPRVAAARGLSQERVRALVRAHVEGRTLGLWGEPRVNVLALNLALDELGQRVTKEGR